MWSRKRLDIGWLDLANGLIRGCVSGDRQGWQHRVEQAWSPRQDALACLSVRSGWDLLLATLDFPQGSEVLMSAVTIPDMARIVQRHGLIPVPLDVAPSTMLPTPAQIAAAVTPRTKAVLIAHLFGASSPLDAHLEVAHRHGLLFVEDCAQAFRGVSFTGHERADVSMFSFGTIKTNTALGGGLLRVRDTALRNAMRQRQALYPVQSSAAYLQRILKYVALKSLSYRLPFAGLLAALRLSGKDCDRVLNNSIRGFPGDRLFEQLRQQPCAALLQMLHRRLLSFDEDRQLDRIRRGRRLAEQLARTMPCPGADASPHVFWVFPLQAADPAAVAALLRRHGFDATQGQSLVALNAPAGYEIWRPRVAETIVAQLLFVPFYEAMPDSELRRMGGVLTAHLQPAGRCNKSSEFAPQGVATA